MKRCPQCEFIYEDDQSLCDMDGVLLVLDSRTLPTLALATVPEKAQPRRNRAVPAFATLILALVLAMVYFVSMRRTTVPTMDSPASVVTTAEPAAVANPTPQAQPSESSQSSESPKEEEAKPATTRQPAIAPTKKQTAAKAAPIAKTKTSTEPKSAEPKKEESKVGSILKKTGRILKKPFKF
jgi:outer membrane biosynthesis protein TonB